MHQSLGLSKYFFISMTGHALAIVGISYNVAAYSPAQLVASNEIFSVSISPDIGQGPSATVLPATMAEEPPAQALLPSMPLKQLPPEKIKRTVRRETPPSRITLARADTRAQSTSENQDDSRGHLALGRSGGGSVGGVSAVYAPKPPYPWAARVAGFEGRVLLELNISELGRVNDARIIESSGREDCDASALKTVKEKWNFEPAKINGTPVDCTERVSVRYVLR